MFTFSVAVFFLIATPGPGVLSAAGVGAAFGYKSGMAYVTGLFIGTNLVCFAVISGLAAVIFSVPYIRTILIIGSALYLSNLAARIAFSGAKISFTEMSKPPGLLSGVVLQFINPKAYAVSTALFSSFAFYPSNLIFEIFGKLVIMNAIWIPLHLLWLFAGLRLNSLNLSDTATRKINLIMSFSLFMVVGLSVWSVW
jgi:threonine/homoserine/homoserine lactone efflux protein